MRTVLWLLLGGLLLVTWLAAPWAAVPWIALCWLAAPLVSWLALAITRRRIRTELTGPGTAEKGKPFSVAASVDSAVPMGRACLMTDVENLATGEKRRQRLTMERGRGEWAMTSGLCGCMQLRGTKLVVWDIFGVLPLAVPCHVHALICVMPDTFPVETDPVLALSSRTDCDEYAPDVKGNDPTEIFQLREYAPGDSLRQIHWKLSGKTGRYMVREGSKPVDHRLTIYVERSAAAPRLTDALLEAAVSLAQAFAGQGQPFRLMWSGEAEGRWEVMTEDQLPEAVAALLKSPVSQEPPSLPEVAEGKLLYCCTQLPAEQLRPENTKILLCADAPCDDGEIICFTPETMRDTLGKWIWN